MPAVIAVEPANSEDAVRLLEARDAELDALYTPEENFRIPITHHVDDKILFLIARENNEAIGCGALKLCAGFGELKSMFVVPMARGRSLGAKLVEALEKIARERGLDEIRLETGIHSPGAIRLYEKTGYLPCARFGDYPENRSSVYMSKKLTL